MKTMMASAPGANPLMMEMNLRAKIVTPLSRRRATGASTRGPDEEDEEVGGGGGGGGGGTKAQPLQDGAGARCAQGDGGGGEAQPREEEEEGKVASRLQAQGGGRGGRWGRGHTENSLPFICRHGLDDCPSLPPTHADPESMSHPTPGRNRRLHHPDQATDDTPHVPPVVFEENAESGSCGDEVNGTSIGTEERRPSTDA